MGDDPASPLTNLPPNGADDPTGVVRVTTTGVRGRPSARVPGGRGPVLLSVVLVTAVVLGGLALRSAPTQTAQSTPGIGAVGAVGATDDLTIEPTPIEPSTTEPEATPYESLNATVLPTLEPTEAATPRPTKKPRPATTPYVEPTDSRYTDWTPPPGFEGSVTLSDNCHHANGLEEVLMQADFNSPADVSEVMFYEGGTDNWIAMGGPPVGQERVGTVIVGRNFEVGTAIVIDARFIHGQQLIDLIAKRQSDPYVVQKGPDCPGG